VRGEKRDAGPRVAHAGEEEGKEVGWAERRKWAALSFPFLLSFFFSALKHSNKTI
jgi:hypothetical protein